MGKKWFNCNSNIFFRKDEEGRDLFYPWGYPGGGVYIDSGKRSKISNFIFMVCLLLVFSFLLADLAHHYKLIDLYFKIVFLDIVWITLPALYYYGVRRLTAGLISESLKTKARPKIFYVLLFLLSIQVLCILGAAYAYTKAPIFMASMLVLHCLYFLILACFASLSLRKVG